MSTGSLAFRVWLFRLIGENEGFKVLSGKSAFNSLSRPGGVYSLFYAGIRGSELGLSISGRDQPVTMSLY